MAGFSLDTLTDVLNETEGTGVSFVGKAKHWGSESDGRFYSNTFYLFLCLF